MWKWGKGMPLEYLKKVESLIQRVIVEEASLIHEAAEKLATVIQSGGILHVFGSGHSHLLVEDLFYRAGGLAPINPILIEPLMLHEGAVRATYYERRHDFAETFMKDYDIQPGDAMVVISTSGKNPVPIDVALIAKQKRAFVIGLTSLDYSRYSPSHHQSGKHLYEVVDLVLDNYAVKGDAMMTHKKTSIPFGPASTVMGSALLNAVMVETTHLLLESDGEAPIFLSANIPGAAEHNNRLVEKYRKRIPLLK